MSHDFVRGQSVPVAETWTHGSTTGSLGLGQARHWRQARAQRFGKAGSGAHPTKNIKIKIILTLSYLFARIRKVKSLNFLRSY